MIITNPLDMGDPVYGGKWKSGYYNYYITIYCLKPIETKIIYTNVNLKLQIDVI